MGYRRTRSRDRVGGVLVGSIAHAEEKHRDYRHAGIDLFIDTPHAGQGVGTDALRTLARYPFEARGHHRLTIDPAAANERAIRASSSAIVAV